MRDEGGDFGRLGQMRRSRAEVLREPGAQPLRTHAQMPEQIEAGATREPAGVERMQTRISRALRPPSGQRSVAASGREHACDAFEDPRRLPIRFALHEERASPRFKMRRARYAFTIRTKAPANTTSLRK